MKKAKVTPEDILKDIIDKAIAMNAITEFDEELEEKFKLIQKATSLTILEPAFDYIEENGDKDMGLLVKNYKKTLEIFEKNGVIRMVDSVKEEINKHMTEKEECEK